MKWSHMEVRLFSEIAKRSSIVPTKKMKIFYFIFLIVFKCVQETHLPDPQAWSDARTAIIADVQYINTLT